jgi:hypothetical protein
MSYELPKDAPFDYTEWQGPTLRAQAKLLSYEKETGLIPRQVERADRELLHVAFELWAREHIDAPRDAVEDISNVRASEQTTA